jgi:hypothetical protein
MASPRSPATAATAKPNSAAILAAKRASILEVPIEPLFVGPVTQEKGKKQLMLPSRPDFDVPPESVLPDPVFLDPD